MDRSISLVVVGPDNDIELVMIHILGHVRKPDVVVNPLRIEVRALRVTTLLGPAPVNLVFGFLVHIQELQHEQFVVVPVGEKLAEELLELNDVELFASAGVLL